MNYRFDHRSKKKFAKDILKASQVEKQILERWLTLVERRLGYRPYYRDHGCDNSGKYLEQKDVSYNADYEVDGFGKIEIKFSYPALNNFFHLKVDQVRSYVQQKATIIMVDGLHTSTPMFTLIFPEDMQKMLDGNMKIVSWKGFGNKLAFRIPISAFQWKNFNG